MLVNLALISSLMALDTKAAFTPDTCSPDISCIHLYPFVSPVAVYMYNVSVEKMSSRRYISTCIRIQVARPGYSRTATWLYNVSGVNAAWGISGELAVLTTAKCHCSHRFKSHCVWTFALQLTILSQRVAHSPSVARKSSLFSSNFIIIIIIIIII